MKGFFVLSILYALAAFSYAANIVCYFNSWTIYRNGKGKFIPQNVDTNLCTHVLFAFVGLNYDGSVRILDDWEAINLNGIRDFINLKQQNPDIKLLVSMGGWNEGSTVYSTVFRNTKLRAAFVQNVANFVNQYGFDGFDLSWEYPNNRGGVPADVQNFVSGLNELKAALGNRTLSIAGAGLISNVDLSYDVPNVANAVDMINLMSYSYHGSYEGFVGHATGLYGSSLDNTPVQKILNVNATVNYWIQKGASPSKLNIGIVTYGTGFTLANAANNALYSPITGDSYAGPYTQQGGMMGYNEICEYDSDWQYIFDDEQKVPHIIQDKQWIGFEDLKSVEMKAQFAKDLNLGGAAIWSLDTDDFLGTCGSGAYPLINKIKSILQ